jgi:hypothetical protein
MATAGSSVKLKRLRQRFGISAPKLSIRTHVAWYWRALAAVAVLSVSLAFAAWIYDAGRRIAGFHSGESNREIQTLREHVVELDAELAKLRSIAGSGESNLQIERATQQQLIRQVKALESENASLKQDLAFFEGLIPASEAGGEVGVKISRLRIEPENVNGQYRYQMLLVHNGGRQAKEFRGALQLLVKVQQAGKDAMITFPSEAERGMQKFNFEIKHFQRAEGVFSVPPGAVVKSVEARLLQDGVVRARQSVTI